MEPKIRIRRAARISEAREYKQGDNAQLTYKQTFDFDRFGNMYRKAASNQPTGQQNPLPYAPIEDADIDKSTNRFTSATGTTYNEAGQVVSDAKFRDISFGYDANGRQVKATKTNTPDALSVYDANGLRVAERVNDAWRYLVYDVFGKLVAEYRTADPSSSAGVKYVLSDWQGSTRASVSGTGFIKSRQDFTAFGEEIGAGTGLRTARQGFGGQNNIRQKYALTERDDATGLDNTWFRKNESKAGRRTSPDPYNGSASIGDPQSFNRYSYVQNDPTNFVDPSGLNLVNYFCYDLNTFWRYGDLLSGVATTTMCYFTPAGGTDSGGSIDSGGGGGGGGGGSGGGPYQDVSEACKRALNVAKQDVNALNRARQASDILGRAGKVSGAPPKLLAAIGVRESGFLNINQRGGFGRGIFQLDTSQNRGVAAIAGDTEKAAVFAGQLFISRLNFHSAASSNYPSENYSFELQFAAALRDYNANNAVTKSIMRTPGATVSMFDRLTARGNYVSNVLDLMNNCF